MKLLSIMPERVARGSFYSLYILSCVLVSVSFCFYWISFHAYGDKKTMKRLKISIVTASFSIQEEKKNSLFKDIVLVFLKT